MRFVILLLLIITSSQHSDAQVGGDVAKNGFRVLKEKEGVIAIDRPELTKGQRILFVRKIPEFDDYETIAQGIVQKSNSTQSIVKMDVDSLKKIPERGDFGVLLGAPKVFSPPPELKPTSKLEIVQEVPLEPESGYIDIGSLYQEGKLTTQTSNRANSYKGLDKVKMSGFQLEWFVDFLPNYGFIYKTSKGSVPISSYYRTVEDASLDRTTMRINYRTRRSDRKLRWTFFIENQTEEFKTGNADEFVLSSRYASMGLGARLAWEMGEILTEKGSLLGRPFMLFIEGGFAPSVTATDLGVARGSAGSGTRLDQTVGYMHLFYWEKIPWLKRYFLELRYSSSDLNLNFAGSVKNEKVTNPYQIPEGGQYRERYANYQVMFGLRFTDFVGRNFKPRN